MISFAHFVHIAGQILVLHMGARTMSFVTLKHQHMRDQWRSQSDLEGKQDCFELRQGERTTTLDYKTAKAEALWCKFILEHNLPFSYLIVFPNLLLSCFLIVPLLQSLHVSALKQLPLLLKL